MMKYLTVLLVGMLPWFAGAALAQTYESEQQGDLTLQYTTPGSGGLVEAVVNDTKRQSIAHFSGDCGADAKVMLVIMDPGAVQTHYASGDPADLQADAVLQALGGVLERSCPQVQTLSVYLTHLPTQTPAVTLSRGSNWGMGQGVVAEVPRPQIRLSQLSNAIMLPEGIACNDPAEIIMDGTQPGRNAARYQVYRTAAKDGAFLHESLCPGTQELRFYPIDHPAGLVCAASDGACYLKATWNPDVARVVKPRPSSQAELVAQLPEMMSQLGESLTQWVVEPVGYAEDPALSAPTIRTAEEMIEVILSQDFTLIREQYSNYFRVFHNQFLFSYSERCSAQVEDPVVFNVTPMEETVFGDGSSTGPRQIGDTYQLTLDRKFEGPYIRYETANKAWLTSQVFTETVDLRASRGGGAGVTRVVGRVLSDKDDIDQFINQGCTAPDVQTVYQSLARIL